MDLLRIAARVAAKAKPLPSGPVSLSGPFKRSKPEEEHELTVPFGFTGDFLPLLVEALGLPDEDAEGIQSGPIDDLPVGYSVDSEYYTPERRSRNWWVQPDDPEEWELIITVTHIAGYELSPEDRQVMDRILNDALHEAVNDWHFERYKERSEPDYDDADDYYD